MRNSGSRRQDRFNRRSDSAKYLKLARLIFAHHIRHCPSFVEAPVASRTAAVWCEPAAPSTIPRTTSPSSLFQSLDRHKMELSDYKQSSEPEPLWGWPQLACYGVVVLGASQSFYFVIKQPWTRRCGRQMRGERRRKQNFAVQRLPPLRAVPWPSRLGEASCQQPGGSGGFRRVSHACGLLTCSPLPYRSDPPLRRRCMSTRRRLPHQAARPPRQ